MYKIIISINNGAKIKNVFLREKYLDKNYHFLRIVQKTQTSIHHR